MNGCDLSAVPSKTELPLNNEQNCEGKHVRAGTRTPRSFRPNRMRYNNPDPKRDFDSIARNTPLRGYLVAIGVVA